MGQNNASADGHVYRVLELAGEKLEDVHVWAGGIHAVLFLRVPVEIREVSLPSRRLPCKEDLGV